MALEASMLELWRHIWDALCRAALDRHASFRLPSLATLAYTAAGQPYPRARTVVLRQAERATGQLVVHSDRRAEKVAEIERCPQVALCFWDRRRREQVRCEAEAEMSTDGAIVDAVWAKLGARGQAIYASPRAPGTRCGLQHTQEPKPAPGPERDAAEPHPPERLPKARQHFCLIRLRVYALDWLRLDRQAPQRARFHRAHEVAEPAGWQGCPVEP